MRKGGGAAWDPQTQGGKEPHPSYGFADGRNRKQLAAAWGVGDKYLPREAMQGQGWGPGGGVEVRTLPLPSPLLLPQLQEIADWEEGGVPGRDVWEEPLAPT